jgi:hypothetical protein
MSSQILIMACGSAFLDRGFKVNRHLVPIAGIPMILRTVRQLAEREHRPTIATYHEGIKRVVGGEADYFLPEYHRWYPETFLHTCSLWTDYNVVLLGDTVYSDEVLDEIMGYLGQDALWIHGRRMGMFDGAIHAGFAQHRPMDGTGQTRLRTSQGNRRRIFKRLRPTRTI